MILAGFGNLEVIVPEGLQKPSGNRLNPPGLTVRFEATYSKDDGALAEAVAAGELIEREEARQRVLELVDAIKFSLDKGEDFLLPEIGVFLKDTDGKVHFRIDPAWILEPDQYGLESMDVFELEELPVEDLSPKASTSENKSSPELTELAPPKPKPKTNRWRIIWVVAAVLITVLVVLLVIPSGKQEEGEGLVDNQTDQEVPEQINTQEELTEETVEEQVSDRETAPEEVESQENAVPTVEETNKFFIIAGSFGKLKNASDLQDQLRSRGFNAEVMITENRMYRVSVESYATKEEAERALIQLKSEPDLESCWLLSN